jgi:pyruvate dehydrogenase E1 component
MEWILLDALKKLHDPEGGRSAYLRLSTKPVDQGIFNSLLEQYSENELREQILRGAYRLIDRSAERDYSVGDNVVHIFGTGAMIPEAVAAAEALEKDGIFANVFMITSADLLFHEHLAAQRTAGDVNPGPWLTRLLTREERGAPLVTVHDGHPLTLAALGGALSMRMANLGVTTFGQTGSPEALCQLNRIAPADIVAAARTLLE